MIGKVLNKKVEFANKKGDNKNLYSGAMFNSEESDEDAIGLEEIS